MVIPRARLLSLRELTAGQLYLHLRSTHYAAPAERLAPLSTDHHQPGRVTKAATSAYCFQNKAKSLRGRNELPVKSLIIYVHRHAKSSCVWVEIGGRGHFFLRY